MASFRAACVQVNASNDMDANLAELHRLIREARAQGADFITTPENASMMAVGRETREKAAPEASHPALAAFREAVLEAGAGASAELEFDRALAAVRAGDLVEAEIAALEKSLASL